MNSNKLDLDSNTKAKISSNQNQEKSENYVEAMKNLLCGYSKN